LSAPISRAFLADLADVFDEHGRAMYRSVRDNDPAAYADIFANVMPKEAAIDIYSDAQFERLCEAIAANLEKAVRNGVETIH
jgi:hypothetical protein